MFWVRNKKIISVTDTFLQACAPKLLVLSGIHYLNTQANQAEFTLHLFKPLKALVGDLRWCNKTF